MRSGAPSPTITGPLFTSSTPRVAFGTIASARVTGRSEMVIRQLLADARVDALPEGLAVIDAAGAEAGADWEDLGSPETYTGSPSGLDSLRQCHRPPRRAQTMAVRRRGGWPPSHPLRQSPAPKAAGPPLQWWQLNSSELCGADPAILPPWRKTFLNVSDLVNQGAPTSIPRLRSESMAMRAVRVIAERQRALLVVVTTSGRVRAKGARERVP